MIDEMTVEEAHMLATGMGLSGGLHLTGTVVLTKPYECLEDEMIDSKCPMAEATPTVYELEGDDEIPRRVL